MLRGSPLRSQPLPAPLAVDAQVVWCAVSQARVFEVLLFPSLGAARLEDISALQHAPAFRANAKFLLRCVACRSCDVLEYADRGHCLRSCEAVRGVPFQKGAPTSLVRFSCC